MEKTKLSGGPEQSVTWVWMEAGRLKVEYYDYSELAQKFFGNDIAWTITVNDMAKLYSSTNQNESSILAWLTESFKSYFSIKQWLAESGIGFSIETESWA